MAMGTTYDNNKNKEHYTPTVYSAYKFSNSEGIDPSMLSTTMWGEGMLKLSISPRKPGDDIRYDHEKAGAIHLNHLKAKQLADAIDLFMEDPKAYNNIGISSGAGHISIDNGIELTGSLNPLLVLRKIKEDGSIEAVYVHQFKHDYHFTIRNFDEKSKDFDKVFDNSIEIHALRDLLVQYYLHMSGAPAYAQMFYGRFDSSRINTKLDSIAAACGVEYPNKKDKGSSSSSSAFFGNNTPRNTISDFDDM